MVDVNQQSRQPYDNLTGPVYPKTSTKSLNFGLRVRQRVIFLTLKPGINRNSREKERKGMSIPKPPPTPPTKAKNLKKQKTEIHSIKENGHRLTKKLIKVDQITLIIYDTTVTSQVVKQVNLFSH